jgi:hypothetical protein
MLLVGLDCQKPHVDASGLALGDKLLECIVVATRCDDQQNIDETFSVAERVVDGDAREIRCVDGRMSLLFSFPCRWLVGSVGFDPPVITPVRRPMRRHSVVSTCGLLSTRLTSRATSVTTLIP